MTREQLLSKVEANIATKPIFFNTAAKIKALFLDIVNAVFDNAGSGDGLIYTNTTSNTSLAVDYNQVKVLTVNYIGAYAVGNLVKITARVAGFMGSFFYLFYLAEITAIDVNTKAISLSLINAGSNYTPACNDWRLSIVSADKWGIDKILSTFRPIKEPAIFIYAPTDATDFINISVSNSQRIFSVLKNAHNQNITINVINDIPENEIFTIINNSPTSVSGNTFTPVTINVTGAGAQFYIGGTSVLLESKGINNSNYSRSIRIMRVGNIFHILN